MAGKSMLAQPGLDVRTSDVGKRSRVFVKASGLPLVEKIALGASSCAEFGGKPERQVNQVIFKRFPSPKRIRGSGSPPSRLHATAHTGCADPRSLSVGHG